MGDEFRFAIVGSGNMAGTYASLVGKLPGMRVVGIVSRSGRRPAPLADARSIAAAPSLEELDTDFDGVIVATPNGAHHRDIVAAARLGKHVLTEKVLDVTTAAMDAAIGACTRNSVKLGVVFQRRMSPDNIVMKGVLDRRLLGRVYAADLTVKFFRDQAYYDSAPYRGTAAMDGGPFMQQAAHNIDIYTWFFGLPQTVASALATAAHDIEAEDHGAAILRYADGMVGTVIASTACAPGFPAKLEIHAENGTVVMVNDEITTWAVPDIPNPSQAEAMTVHSGAANAAVSDTAGHEAVITDFVEAVRQDRPPAITGESARKATELVLMIYGSDIGPR